MIDARQILRLGPPLRVTPTELDALATVTPMDVALARVLWEREAPPALRGLLEARRAETEDLSSPKLAD